MRELQLNVKTDETDQDSLELTTGVSNSKPPQESKDFEKICVTQIPKLEDKQLVEVVLNKANCESFSIKEAHSLRSSTWLRRFPSIFCKGPQKSEENIPLRSPQFEGSWIWQTPKCVWAFEISREKNGGLVYIEGGKKFPLKQKSGRILESSKYEFWMESDDQLIRKKKSGDGSQVKATRQRTVLNLEREVRQLKKYLCLYTTMLDFRVSPGYEANVNTPYYNGRDKMPPLKVLFVGCTYVIGAFALGIFSHYFWLFKGLDLPNLLLSIIPSVAFLTFFVYLVFYNEYYPKKRRGFFRRDWIEPHVILPLGWLSAGLRVYCEVVLREGVSFSNLGALLTFGLLFFKLDVIIRDYVCKEPKCGIPIHEVRDKIGKYLIDCEVGLPAECRRPLKKGEI